MVAFQTVADVLVVRNGDAFSPVLAQVFVARVFGVVWVWYFPGVIFEFRLAINARVFGRRTDAFVKVNVGDAGGAVAAIVIGADVARGHVSVAVGSLIARLTKTTVTKVANWETSGAVLTQIVIANVITLVDVVTFIR